MSNNSSRVLSTPHGSQSTLELKLKYPFNEESDDLWACSLSLVARGPDSTRRIEPLHLALVLLFDGLSTPHDSRLFGAIPEPTRESPLPLEKSLFWIAISKVSRSYMSNSLVEHIQITNNCDDSEFRPQLAVGKALWDKELESESIQVPPKVTIDETNVRDPLLAD